MFSLCGSHSLRALVFGFSVFVALFSQGATAQPAAGASAEAASANDSVTCPSCRGDAVCHAKGCKEGKVPCPATCLKRDAPGWTKKKIEGFPDDYIWMGYPYKVGGETRIQYVSQNHIGELIENDENGRPVTRGRCPTCQGTSRVECASCKGAGKCATCAGAGKFVRGEALFTLTDLQGRSLEAVVKARTAAAVTVMRLADQKTFDIPLANLSPESLKQLEPRFPAVP